LCRGDECQGTRDTGAGGFCVGKESMNCSDAGEETKEETEAEEVVIYAENGCYGDIH